ncbi:MAG: hypothetical protein Terrestrivirus3_83 [Terrestrivirus sp.]|uniref:WLM domain-containing protein n=1 Tax=Terrestrivirus sp. TaxID=2487775 RepID=A0A3G4ZN33_9VIRU|nr:MAG: hypothetical protein Terrestrivirus3_83 [Terrestrivirus sp.]
MSDIILSDKCVCSVGCDVHAPFTTKFLRYLFPYTGFKKIILDNVKTDFKNKQYLCSIANHPAINFVMFKENLSVDSLQELSKKSIDLCKQDHTKTKTKVNYILFGLCNVTKKNKVISVRICFDDGRYCKYSGIINTIIHEITHINVKNHGDAFNKRQLELTNIYNNYKIYTNYCKILLICMMIIILMVFIFVFYLF